MKCPDIEALINFAASSPLEEHETIASHIFACMECRREFREALDAVNMDETECTRDERALVRKFVREKLEKVSWERLAEKIEQFCVKAGEQLRKIPMVFDAVMPAYPMPLVPGAAKADASEERSAEYFNIVFAAEDPESPHYWKAVVTIPKYYTDNTQLQIQVYDREERLVPFGELLFLGVPLRVNSGNTHISFLLFRQNLKNTEVSFSLPGGSPVRGALRFESSNTIERQGEES